ncbi:MAG: HDOD domain-containing protein [Epsilonproteobacteria bacterium]|nr:HDOD domain-containing protein [Campylobacterota bacterium]
MLISKQEIEEKLQTIPPLPESVKSSIEYLKQGDLQRAADVVDNDLVLKKKIEAIVNSAYFGFSKKLTDTRQMFSAMGLEMAKSVILSYMVSLITPKEWKVFTKLNFEDFQSAFLSGCKDAIILETDLATYKKYADSVALIPATICLIDEILGAKGEKLEIFLASADLNFGQIVKRFTGMSMFELGSFVAEKWELDKPNINMVKYAECANCKCLEDLSKEELEDEEMIKNIQITSKLEKVVAATLHLEFFYTVSKPAFFQLNSFIDFNDEVINIAKKNYERKLNEE